MNNKEIIHNDLVVERTMRAWLRDIFGLVEIYIMGRNASNNNKVIVPKLEFIEIDFGDDPPAPIAMRFDQAQILMDDLWNCGLRPSEGTGSAGSLKATESHLKDMRDLVWKLLPNLLRTKNE